MVATIFIAGPGVMLVAHAGVGRPITTKALLRRGGARTTSAETQVRGRGCVPPSRGLRIAVGVCAESGPRVAAVNKDTTPIKRVALRTTEESERHCETAQKISIAEICTTWRPQPRN